MGQRKPLALLTLKATGTCQVTIPEWVYDLDCPGHYMRRIKSVALSIPCVAGPYTSGNCTLSLLKSTIRKTSIGGGYVRQGSEDDRFVDYVGAVQSIVTSSVQNDSGMFETNLHEERFLPFEGAGTESTWKLKLPKVYRAFDYDTISDIILQIRYTERQGVDPSKVTSAVGEMFTDLKQSNLAMLFSLRHDFSTEWSAFVNSTTDAPFTATIHKDYFPYFTQGKGKAIKFEGMELCDGTDLTMHHPVGDPVGATTDLSNDKKEAIDFTASLDPAGSTQILSHEADEVFLIIRYTLE